MKIIEKYLQFSLPLKLIASSLIFVIAGPGFFYFLTEYATYFYVISLGVRAPFEGVPYLSATVALLSVILALSASVVFIITRLIIAGIGFQIVKIISGFISIAEEGLTKYREKGGKLFHKFSFFNVFSSIEELSLKDILRLSFVFLMIIFIIVGNKGLVVLIVGSSYLIIALFTIWSKKFSWFIATLVVLLFYISSISFILDSERYKMFLQVVGYGGGIPIKVKYKESSSVERLNLIIRTSSSLLSEQNESGEYIEIPMGNIEKIIYEQHVINAQ